MRTNNLSSTILGIIALILLIITNPKEQQLKDYMALNIREQTAKEGLIVGALGELLADPGAWLLSLNTHRSNYYFFSIYTVTMFEEEHKYIGLINTFIEI